MRSILVTKDAAKKQVHVAMTSQQPDQRRHAIEQLTVTGHAARDFVVDPALSIAKLDPSDSVRISAIRLAAESQRPDVARELVGILLVEKGTLEPTARVREEILRGLSFLAANKSIPDDDSEAVGATAAQLLRLDSSRNVRIAAATLLAHFKRTEAVHVLIAALSDRDFGVTYHAHESLVQLTGQDLGQRSDPWRQWLDQTDTPFVNAGAIDAERKSTHWWQRVVRSLRGKTSDSSLSATQP